MVLHVSTVTDLAAFERLGPEWDALLARTENELPFLLHDWMFAWWRHFAQDSRAIKDSLFIQTVRTDTGELVGIAPLMRTERPGRGPFRVRSLTLLGADPYITELRRPIAARGHEANVARAIVQSLLEKGGWDWIQWAGLIEGSPFADDLARALPIEWTVELPAHEMVLAPTWEAFKTGLKRNIKESLRRCQNAPKRDGHEMVFSVARTPTEITAALDIFLRLHAMRAELESTVDHPNRFESRVATRFLRDVVERLAAKDVVRVFILSANGEPVACRVGFMLSTSLYLYYSGFDPAWGKYSVMTTTVADAIKYAIEAQKLTVHLSTGTDVSKTRWGPRETMFRDAIQLRPTMRSRLAREVFRAGEAAQRDPRLKALVGLLPKRTLE